MQGKALCLTGVMVILGLASGCGGGGSAGSGGASSPGSSAPSTSVAHKHKPTKHQLMSDSLWKFLQEVRPIRARSNHAGDLENRYIVKILNVCCVDWPQAAASARHAAKVERNAADRLAAIPAPTPLQRSYVAYVDSYRDDAQIDSDFAAQLASQQSFEWSTYQSRWTARAAPVTRFRITLIQYAAVNHLSLPQWIHNIGD